MTKIYITKHGETQWNVQRRFQGRKDSKLTELGIKQAKLLAKRLEDVNFAAIYSSSSGRALQTAELIKGNRNINIIPSDEIREIYLGDWEGKCIDEIEKFNADEYKNFLQFPHVYKPVKGENFYDVQKRAVNFMEKVVERHKESNILIVAHSAVVKVLMAYYEGREMKDLWKEPSIRPTCLNTIEVESGKYKIGLYGDVSHYDIAINE